ncbi:MAG: LysR family transcriptional regulator [Terriglobia bacterium]|jgi:DNA-binding transcriptional LysR family regulator
MDLRQLEMFRALAETSSFTRAGERLHVSHSAISRQVKLLEDELSVVLFTRANKRVFLTEPGRVLFNHTGAIFAQVTDATRSVSQMSNGAVQYLNLGTGTTMLNLFLPPVFEEFKKRYPNVVFHIKTGHWPMVIEDIRTGVLDVVLGSLPSAVEARDYLVRPLYREELVVVVGKHHTLAKKRVIQPQELNEVPLITFSYSVTRQILETVFRDLGISPQIKLEMEDDEALVSCVSKNMGVAFLPKRRAMQERMHFLRILGCPIFRTVGLVTLRARQASEHLTYFSTLCLQRSKSVFPLEPPSLGPKASRQPSSETFRAGESSF